MLLIEWIFKYFGSGRHSGRNRRLEWMIDGKKYSAKEISEKFLPDGWRTITIKFKVSGRKLFSTLDIIVPNEMAEKLEITSVFDDVGMLLILRELFNFEVDPPPPDLTKL